MISEAGMRLAEAAGLHVDDILLGDMLMSALNLTHSDF
jgi:hypothetical protein